jgi:hypothetical protein
MDDLFPPLDEALLKRLDEIYPEACPDPDDTDREIWLAVGARQLVRMLWAVYLEQQNEE